jgi:hypothetical protein
MTEPPQSGTITDPYDNQKNNSSNYIPELDEGQGDQYPDYWYVPEPDEGRANSSE